MSNSIFFRHICCAFVLALASTTQCSLGERLVFAKEFFNSPVGVGTVFPCSKLVGTELVKYLVKLTQENPNRSLRILEVGAGTGSITEVIAGCLRSRDHLDAVELSKDMCTVLHQKFDSMPNVSVRCLSILDWQPEDQYDLIISTLPFTLFDVGMMASVIEHLKKLIKPNGILSYVAYVGGATLKKLFSWGEKGKEHAKKIAILKKLRKAYEIDKAIVWKNVPPIHVYHLQFKGHKSSL